MHIIIYIAYQNIDQGQVSTVTLISYVLRLTLSVLEPRPVQHSISIILLYKRNETSFSEKGKGERKYFPCKIERQNSFNITHLLSQTDTNTS